MFLHVGLRFVTSLRELSPNELPVTSPLIPPHPAAIRIDEDARPVVIAQPVESVDPAITIARLHMVEAALADEPARFAAGQAPRIGSDIIIIVIIIVGAAPEMWVAIGIVPAIIAMIAIIRPDLVGIERNAERNVDIRLGQCHPP